MASLQLRQARLQATLKAISNIQPNPPAPKKPSYAAVTARLTTLQKDMQAQKNGHPTTHTQTFQNIHTTHSQGVPHPRAFTSINGSTNNKGKVRPNSQEETEQGWVKVVRKQKTRNKQPKDTIPLNPYIKKRQLMLMAQGRCFKCLEKGHNKAQCRNIFKCHKCHGVGHRASHCVRANRTFSTNRAIPQQTNHQNHYNPIPATEQTTQPEKTTTKMDFQNWEAMEMLSPEYMNNAREDDVRVFMPADDTLRPTNDALSRAAVVMIGPQVEARTIPQRLAANLGMYFNRHPRDFSIRKTEPTTGDFIAIFPTINMRNEAVQVGVFVIDQTTDVQLAKWTPARGMVRVPVSHRARIKMINVPLGFWNFEALDHIVSGFGYLLRMNQVQQQNGNYENLKILIACHNPGTIPRTMLLSKSIRGVTHSTVITLELEGWLHLTTNPNPPEVDEEQVHEALIHNRNRQAERRRQRGQASPRRTRRQRNGYQTDGSSSGYSWRADQQLKWVPKKNDRNRPVLLQRKDARKPLAIVQEQQGQPMFPVAIASEIGSRGINYSQGGVHVLTKYTTKSYNMGNGQVQTFNSLYATVTVQHVTMQVLFFSPTFSPRDNQALFNFSSLTPSRQTENFQLMGSATFSPKVQQPINFEDLYYTPSLGPKPHSSLWEYTTPFGLLEGETEMGHTNQEPNPELLLNGPAHQPQAETGEENVEPPPGFPLQIYGSHSINNITPNIPPQSELTPRRSNRLSEKNTGIYTSTIEKAQITQGYATAASRPTPTRKKTQPKPVKLTYQQSHDPLSAAQAEAVVATAGIELGEELAAKIRTFVETGLVGPANEET
ncbi:hypothetical protein FCM35_KLT00189 [Carex littledalei]|uniref:CCHC-type domain-containing protein n=1 Tax=Carex littledalei TaxID=544730 RepID=A0A833RM47_9POAL|nr:hypothetical protein FCM35_KLT00189 [Carex littledalei]